MVANSRDTISYQPFLLFTPDRETQSLMAGLVLQFTSKPALLTLFLLFSSKNVVASGCYTSIFSFGDSLTDTGNLVYMDRNDCANHDPYGETIFHRPTGRCSDGRLIIDFIAQAIGLPLIPPYFGHGVGDFGKGVNFAVAGGTALDAAFLEKKGVQISRNYSLKYQLEWFKQILPPLYGSPTNCRNRLGSALFMVGEIGGNDYASLGANEIQAMRQMVPDVVNIISSTITVVSEILLHLNLPGTTDRFMITKFSIRSWLVIWTSSCRSHIDVHCMQALIKEGAVTLLVPGIEAFGCFPTLLTLWASPNQQDYEPSTGCLKVLNKFSEFHNNMLQKELNRLREIHPHATIIYVDYYNAMMDMYRFPHQLGFRGGALQACCGGGGPYNYNSSAKCGCGATKVCDDPSLYVSWDGSHLTDAAHKFTSRRILEGFTNPPINLSCISSMDHAYA